MNDMPSVTRFWEMLLCDLEAYFHDNQLDFYSLNSLMLECGKLPTEDGKLVIYIQHDKPSDPTQRQNWLPPPKECFRFTAHFYGPYRLFVDSSYNMPGIVRVE